MDEQSFASIAGLSDGRFALSWKSYESGSDYDIRAVVLSLQSDNAPPTITSDGGGETAAIAIAENSTDATTVTAADPDAADVLTYSISGGTDAGLFTIDSGTGALAFTPAPDFEAPADADGDNVYEVTVAADDGAGGIDTQAICVSVTNAAGITVTSNAATITGTNEEDVLTGLGGANALHGLGGNDTLNGGAGADTLQGGAGNDILIGSLGNDTVNGDTGNDTFQYTVGDGADIIDGGADTDTLHVLGTAGANALNVVFGGTVLTSVAGSAVSNVESVTADLLGGVDALNNSASVAAVYVDLVSGTASGFSMIGGIENVTGGSGADSLTGDAADNTLSGGGGNDVISGGFGNDVLVGSAGIDMASFETETDDIFIDLATGTTRRGAEAADVEDKLSSIENIRGGHGDDTIDGNSAANYLDGGNGDDVLRGAAGADILAGTNGNDSMWGGTGNDAFYGGDGDDNIFCAMGDGSDAFGGGAGTDSLTVIGNTSADVLDVIFDGFKVTLLENGGIIETEILNADLANGTDRLSYAGTSIGITVDLSLGQASGFASIANLENITGGSGNDSFIGDAQANNFAGCAGDDTYFLGAGDTATEAAGAGVDTVMTAISIVTLGANLENLIFTGVGNFSGTGTSTNNLIWAGGGHDVLSGGGGDDTIIGGAGTDVMNGGIGNDTFVFAAGFGNDVISGFDANPSGGQDMLDVSELGIHAADFVSRILIEDLGTDTRVTIDGTNTIVLQGVNGVGANIMHADDFFFA